MIFEDQFTTFDHSVSQLLCCVTATMHAAWDQIVSISILGYLPKSKDEEKIRLMQNMNNVGVSNILT